MARRLAFLATVLLALTGGAGAPAPAAAAGRYVAIGDSIAAAAGSYVDLYAARHGITDVHKLTSGDTAAQALASELPAALTLIGEPSDTTTVTVQIGGHDYLTDNCDADWNLPTCDFADSFAALLDGLRAALAADAGSERFVVVAYYNPASGLGGDIERSYDLGLRGTDVVLDTAAHGDAWGLTDVSGWLACRRGAVLADPWAAFKSGGQALMADSLHPTAAGQELLADLVEDPATGGPAPTCPLTTPFAQTAADAGDGRAHGVVEPRLAAARWWFEYGPSTDYGNATAVAELGPSAGARAVAAPLPATGAPTIYHVRLVAENDHGRFAGADRVVVLPQTPELTAQLRGDRTRRMILARGVRLHVRTTGTSLAVRGRLRRRGRDPLVLSDRIAWAAGAERDVRVTLGARGRRLLRRAHRPRIALTLVARGPGGVSPPLRIVFRVR
jgi:lysophospholipase L1-like esterase